MCSFIFTNLKLSVKTINYINKYLQNRGPDSTNIKIIDNYTFIHNLLHITGERIIQPFIKDTIICFFNGEILLISNQFSILSASSSSSRSLGVIEKPYDVASFIIL